MTRDEIHRLVAGVLGEMSRALAVPVRDRAVVLDWAGRLERAAAALRDRAGEKR